MDIPVLNIADMDGDLYIIKLTPKERSFLLAMVIHQKENGRIGVFDYNEAESIMDKLKQSPPHQIKNK